MTKVALLISVAALAGLAQVSIIPQARAGETEAMCPGGDATLRGAYMSMGGGSVVGVGPVAFIGTLYYDGKGNVVNPFTVSVNGAVSKQTVTGTYTVNSDCTGTLSGGGSYDFRVSPDGNKVDYIETDGGTVISGSATRVNE
jgi:hypothetical protein